MIGRSARRLPGMQFEDRPPRLPEALPRMDVAVFVGFAEKGPLHTPVPVEDPLQFRDLFGDPPVLAWDSERGEPLRAQLGPAVRAFFENGGVRCWVVRVARHSRTAGPAGLREQVARSNRFRIPGLLRASQGQLLPAMAVARCEGSFSDDLRLGAALAIEPLGVSALSIASDGTPISLRVDTPDAIALGDLLRLRITPPPGHAELTLLAVVNSLGDDLRDIHHLGLAGSSALWLSGAPPQPPPVSEGWHAEWFPGPEDVPSDLSLVGVPRFDGETMMVRLAIAPLTGQAPPLEPGHSLRLYHSRDSVWMLVTEAHTVDDGSPPQSLVELHGSYSHPLAAPPLPVGTVIAAERLRLELAVRHGQGRSYALRDLGLGPGHPRWLGALPSDRTLFADGSRGGPVVDRRPFAERLCALLGDGMEVRSYHRGLWQAVQTPRFPLACDEQDAAAFLPLGLPVVPAWFLAAVPTSGTALERDGLSHFDEHLFLDAALADETAESLLAQADFLRWQSPHSRPLDGLHAALSLEEASLIALPDVIHRGWTKESVPPQPLPPPPSPPVAVPTTRFSSCQQRMLSAPAFQPAPSPDAGGSYRLTFSAVASAHAYVIEEATRLDFADAVVVYRGAVSSMQIFGRAPGSYCYRVRVEGSETKPARLHPPSGSTIATDTQVLLEVREQDGTRFRISARYEGVDGEETIYDGSDWGSRYQNPATSRQAVAGGWQFFLRREGGWPGQPALRVVALDTQSPWSAALVVSVAPPARQVVNALSTYSSSVLLTVQQALLRMSAARGELFAVLALPEHFREAEAVKYAAELRRTSSERISSYGGLYHPWLIADGTPAEGPRRSPPDGALCGILARRATTRGAWIPPANEPLRGVLGLTPTIARQHWQRMLDAQVNLIRDEPQGFVVMGADTLARDPQLQPIQVRRLLSLLRRMALRLGSTYVFELNNGAFGRMVERGFDSMLSDLFQRGAFSGPNPQSSFQVVVDESVNPPQSLDLGRFTIELKVAPSQPLSFLTLRLVQSGDRGTVSEGR